MAAVAVSAQAEVIRAVHAKQAAGLAAARREITKAKQDHASRAKLWLEAAMGSGLMGMAADLGYDPNGNRRIVGYGSVIAATVLGDGETELFISFGADHRRVTNRTVDLTRRDCPRPVDWEFEAGRGWCPPAEGAAKNPK